MCLERPTGSSRALPGVVPAWYCLPRPDPRLLDSLCGPPIPASVPACYTPASNKVSLVGKIP